MIYGATRTVPHGDVSQFTWGALAQFQNIPFVSRQIARLQGTNPSQARNVKKQAQQIRYCIQQASEYFKASQSVTMATRPLLLYYGVMSLALAEILLKSTGDYSLDRARSNNKHHGLTLVMDKDPSKLEPLAESASSLRATPLLRDVNGRKVGFGTFELWHSVSRETPLCGTVTTVVPGGTQEHLDIVMNVDDVRMPTVPEDGLTLLQCFQTHPGMSEMLGRNGVRPTIVRATTAATINSGVSKCHISIQPSDNIAMERCYELMRFHPSAVNRLNIVEFTSGVSIDWSDRGGDQFGLSIPCGIQEWTDQSHLFTDIDCLNEFGVIYYGIYIIGNYVRYYPDQWMLDVEMSSPLALAANVFADIVFERAPLLSLSELTRAWYLRRA